MNLGFFPVCKIDSELRIVKGPALRPEMRDRQGSIISQKVIQDAAHDFTARLNATKGGSKPGFMHSDFSRKLEIVESYVTDHDLTYALNEQLQKIHAAVPVEGLVKKSAAEDGEVEKVFASIPAGSWILAFKVHDDEIWQGILDGTFKGFSIGGRCTIKYEEEEAA